MHREDFMRIALLLAKEAAREGEVPVGCVIVRNNEIISSGRNRREAQKRATAHAEIEAIDAACFRLGNWRLSDCQLYVTLEPCPMCTGAILNARIPEIYYGSADATMGACGSVINLFYEDFNFSPKITGGILSDESALLLQDFFLKLRSHTKKSD